VFGTEESCDNIGSCVEQKYELMPLCYKTFNGTVFVPLNKTLSILNDNVRNNMNHVDCTSGVCQSWVCIQEFKKCKENNCPAKICKSTCVFKHEYGYPEKKLKRECSKEIYEQNEATICTTITNSCTYQNYNFLLIIICCGFVIFII
jgi:hypothetical protein